MSIVPKSTCNRVASNVDLKKPTAHFMYTNLSLASMRKRNLRGGEIMRKLITIEQFIEDFKAEGLETDQVYIDPDDAVQIPEAEDQDD